MLEAIGAFATPAIRDRVLQLAFRWARRPDVPQSGAALREFVHDSLRLAAEEVLGKSAARAIVEELTPMVEAVGRQEISEVRPSWPELAIIVEEDDDATESATEEPIEELIEEEDDFPELAFEEPPLVHAGTPAVGTQRPRLTDPAPASMPLVLVASLDPGTVQALSSALAGHATLEPVRDALTLLEIAGETSSILVIDCERPSVRLETLLALAPELPPQTRVVLWGERADLRERLALLGSGMPEAWVRCGDGATAMDVAAVCRILHD